MALELAKMGHKVTSFSNLPKEGPDAIAPGTFAYGVTWANMDRYAEFLQGTELDLLVVQRDARLLNLPHQAHKAVLWAHDLATHTMTREMTSALGTNWNEVWCVSEFHRQQFHEITGYPLERIKATRNGILPVKTLDMGPRNKTLLFSARPERGLEHLVKPGGIMDQLDGSGFKLKVSMYANFPQQLEDYYRMLWQQIEDRPDCEMMGTLTQEQLRQEMRNAFAYVYCTDFEETSCLIAREAAEQGLPIIYSPVGALPETVGKGNGIQVKGPAALGHDNKATYKKFANAIRKLDQEPKRWSKLSARGSNREDLYWDGVARQWDEWAAEQPSVTLFSRAWSLVEDSDVIPAIALLESSEADPMDWASIALYYDLKKAYPFLSFNGKEPKVTLKEHYDHYYKELERPKTDLAFHDVRGQHRFQALNSRIKDLPAGSKILDYACGEGSQLICLAMENPDKEFYGIDISEDEIECFERNHNQVFKCRVGWRGDGTIRPANIKKVWVGTCDDWPQALVQEGPFDAAMMNEVLEHVHEPWSVAEAVESMVKPGGRIILTVPYGAWELEGCRKMEDHWYWRAHCWHLDVHGLNMMFKDKTDNWLAKLPAGNTEDLRVIGNTVYSYTADHTPIHPIDPLEKAKTGWVRQTAAAAIICHSDEENIVRMLKSISHSVQVIQFAQGPSTDSTREVAERYFDKHAPWVIRRWFDVPAIQAPPLNEDGEAIGVGFGFEDARNKSCEGLDEIVDWTLWIDTDEYLSGNIRRFMKDHAFEGFAIHQHHFTVDPRGEPAQIDRPARLFRNRRGFKCYGKVHEHFETGPGEGPGHCHLLTSVDIGHAGYVNEDTRRLRFERNFPLLCWDMTANPKRKLNKFLWFRDMIHRMRYNMDKGDTERAVFLAKKSIEYYNEHRNDMDSFGNGTFQAFAYLGEAHKLLGKGLGVRVQVQIFDVEDPSQTHSTQFEGIATDSEQVNVMMSKLLDGEIEQRGSKYWR
jgi:2-polyprenyl-3-methyl-5-hydroxy-6-metoxy-1,4-benzoquinol methylase/glycosyltransferase involved in cell wall biosynthesis